MDSSRVDRYWRVTFGSPPEQYEREGVVVVPHPQKLAGRKGAWILSRGAKTAVIVPADMVADVALRSKNLPPAAMLERVAVVNVFGREISRLVGPSYQGFLERDGFRPSPDASVRPLTPDDRATVAKFLNARDEAERSDSGLTSDNPALFGRFEGETLVALGGILPWASYAANLGVIVHPLHRGRGFAKTVTSAVIEGILAQDKVVLYQTLLGNQAAVRLAASLGCEEYARMLYVGFAQ